MEKKTKITLEFPRQNSLPEAHSKIDKILSYALIQSEIIRFIGDFEWLKMNWDGCFPIEGNKTEIIKECQKYTDKILSYKKLLEDAFNCDDKADIYKIQAYLNLLLKNIENKDEDINDIVNSIDSELKKLEMLKKHCLYKDKLEQFKYEDLEEIPY